ncbi:MAG: hypothetical protein IJA04_08805 [Bacteroidaceae bacterium]|nr:hypothetical protein [Bacteroidaceae bacterium]
MKIPIKKYWWIALVILLLPITINFVLLIPSFTAVVGDEIAWLSFWGGYLGAIISTAAAFIILYIQRKDNESENEKNRVDNEVQNKQNREENEKLNRANRQLQLNIMKYHQQYYWLDEFRNASLKYSQALNNNNLVLISNMMWEHPQDAFNIVKQLFDDLDTYHAKFAFTRKQNEESATLAQYIREKAELYRCSLNDLQWVVLYFKAHAPQFRCKCNFIQYLQSYPDKRANTEHILQLAKMQTEQVISGNNLKYFNDIFHTINTSVDGFAYDVQSKLYEYIKQEQNNIDKLLTENIEH